MTPTQPFTLEQKVQAQAIEMLFNPGIDVSLLEPKETQPQPKFQPGEEVVFMITLPVTAVIGDVAWSETTNRFLYSVKETSCYIEELDSDLNPGIELEYLGSKDEGMVAVIDEYYTSLPEYRLLKTGDLPPGDLTSSDYLPSCEFDPN